MKRIGWVQTDKVSSFFNFPKEKTPGFIRIGCFGNSFTHGDEVKNDLDYPSLLQEIFWKHGYKNVEVLNFGVSWYGFHQLYILWEAIGKQYDLDYLLLGPWAFYDYREYTFNHSYKGSGYLNKDFSAFHSRYIFKDNKLKLIDVIGDDVNEIVDNYYRFIPYLQYLRYDYEPPAFLTAPLSFFKPDKRLKKNPFYYQKDLDKELTEIYRQLINIMTDNSKGVLLFNYVDSVLNMSNIVNKSNFYTSVITHNSYRFPYKAFGGHESPAGNKYLAQALFDFLSGKTKSSIDVLGTKDINMLTLKKVVLAKLPLLQYKDATIVVDGVVIGRFFDSNVKDWGDYCSYDKCEQINHFLPFSGATSVVALKLGSDSILDAVFIPLNIDIREKIPVSMKIRNKSHTNNISLGSVNILNSNLNIGTVELGSAYFDRINKHIRLDVDNELYNEMPKLKKGDNITIYINDIPVLSSKIDKDGDLVLLKPLNRRFILIRADGREKIDIKKFDEEGVIYLYLYKNENEYDKIPFAMWYRFKRDVVFNSPISSPIMLRNGRAQIKILEEGVQ